MRQTWRAMIAAGMVIGGAGAAWGQILVEPPAPATRVGTAEGVPAGAATQPKDDGFLSGKSTVPTTQRADAVLQELLKEKGTVGENGTVSAATVSPGLGENGLLREGQRIEYRTGRLRKQEGTGVMQFVFDNKAGEPAYPIMGVVPSQRLAIMEDASQFGATAMTFSIVAEVTQYRGQNYLYFEKPGAESREKRGMPEETATASAPAAASMPAGAVGDAQQLFEPVAPNMPVAAKLNEKDMIWGRMGRLARDPKTGTELFSFESDGKSMYDPPVGLIPSSFLAVMEDATDKGGKPVKFRVTGTVTQYRGKSYLFLKSVQVIKDLHQGLGG